MEDRRHRGRHRAGRRHHRGRPASNAFPAYLTAFDNKLYFVTTIGGIGQLWSFDGTTATQVTHFSESAGNLANNPSVFGLLVSNNKLYFDYFTGAFDGTSQQLYTLDTGVALGAHLIAPSHLGQGGAPPTSRTSTGTLYFTQSDGVHGSELWKSNGTDAGTVMIKDINPGDNNSNSNPYDFVKMGSWIYFVALDGTHGFELWKTDGLVGGTTEMVKDINTTASGPFTEGGRSSPARTSPSSATRSISPPPTARASASTAASCGRPTAPRSAR
ncbi:MAG: ELWxxDGT repeat protein [Rhizomicrobium sp.]